MPSDVLLIASEPRLEPWQSSLGRDVPGLRVAAHAEGGMTGPVPDLVLLDPLMPRPGARAAVRRLREWGGDDLSIAVLDRSRHRLHNRLSTLEQLDVAELLPPVTPDMSGLIEELARGRAFRTSPDEPEPDRDGSATALAGEDHGSRGDMFDLPPPELLMAVWRRKLSGVLRLQEGSAAFLFWFRRGTVVYAEDQDEKFRRPELYPELLNVAETDMNKAVERSAELKTDLGTTLVSMGLASMHDVLRVENRAVDQAVHDGLTLLDGEFDLMILDDSPPRYRGTGYSTPWLVVRALMEREDDREVAQAAASWSTGLKLHPGSWAALADLPASNELTAVLSAVGEGGTSLEIQQRSNLEPARCLRAIYSLVTAGALWVRSESDPDYIEIIKAEAARKAEEEAKRMLEERKRIEEGAGAASLLEALEDVSEEINLADARRYVAAGKGAIAVRELRLVLADRPDHTEAVVLLGEAMMKFPTADEISLHDTVQRLKRAATAEPENARAPWLAGAILHRLGEINEARVELEEAVRRGGDGSEEARFLLSEL